MNVYLCGMMGSGKTTVGQAVAKISGKEWLDTDDVIESRHGKISAIFATHGEEYFRGLERALVEELAQRDGLVVSTGGGLVLWPENVKNLKKSGKTVFLRAHVETLKKRLEKDDKRPLLKGEKTLEERLRELLEVRAHVYENAADYIIDVDGKTVGQIADEIVRLVGKE